MVCIKHGYSLRQELASQEKLLHVLQEEVECVKREQLKEKLRQAKALKENSRFVPRVGKPSDVILKGNKEEVVCHDGFDPDSTEIRYFKERCKHTDYLRDWDDGDSTAKLDKLLRSFTRKT